MKKFFVFFILFFSLWIFWCDSKEEAEKHLNDCTILWEDCYKTTTELIEKWGNNITLQEINNTKSLCEEKLFFLNNLSAYDKDYSLINEGKNLVSLEIHFLDFLKENFSFFTLLFQELTPENEQYSKEHQLELTTFVEKFLKYDQEIEKQYQQVLDTKKHYIKTYQLDEK